MMSVAKSLVSKTTGLLVTHFGISFVEFWYKFLIELFTLNLNYLLLCPFFPHLLQFTYYMDGDPPFDTLPFPLW